MLCTENIKTQTNNICFILFLGCLLFPILLNFNFNLTKAAITVKLLKFSSFQSLQSWQFCCCGDAKFTSGLATRGMEREREKPSSLCGSFTLPYRTCIQHRAPKNKTASYTGYSLHSNKRNTRKEIS